MLIQRMSLGSEELRPISLICRWAAKITLLLSLGCEDLDTRALQLSPIIPNCLAGPIPDAIYASKVAYFARVSGSSGELR